MDGPGLSGRELRILDEIERDLSTDSRLERALRTMRRGPRWVLGGALRAVVRAPVAALSLLLALSAGLALVSPDVQAPGVLAFFALVWAGTVLLTGARLLARRRGLGGSA